MKQTPAPDPYSVLILKADKLYAESLRKLIRTVLPQASIQTASTVASAAAVLTAKRIDLLITGVGASLDGDVFDILPTGSESPSRVERVLVITTNHEHRQLTALRHLPIQGVFDSASEPTEQFKVALRLVAGGGIYWSRSFLDQLRHHAFETNSLSRLLTNAEQLVLSIVGDGSDDNEAAGKLGLSPATVSTVRRNIHRKLGVQHRGQLIRVAAQNGFVRFTPTGIVRPGFALLAGACQQRTRARLAAMRGKPSAVLSHG